MLPMTSPGRNDGNGSCVCDVIFPCVLCGVGVVGVPLRAVNNHRLCRGNTCVLAHTRDVIFFVDTMMMMMTPAWYSGISEQAK